MNQSAKTHTVATGISTIPPVARLGRGYMYLRAYLQLTKPRIALLLVFTGYCAMIVAKGQVPDFRLTALTLIGLAFSAGGAAAINMWFDRDIDAVMIRTKSRPLVQGIVSPRQTLGLGVSLGVASIVLLASCVNLLTAALSLAGYVYYAVIYTMLLKRRTPQNIVIGGGAGAFPPLIGWSAVTGHVGLVSILMFATIFFWTPAHFWSLALYRNEDYSRARIPMMPVVRGKRATKQQMMVYTLILIMTSIAIDPSMRTPICYIVGVVALGLWFLYAHVRLLGTKDTDTTWDKKTFHASLLYLPVIFTWMVICTLI